MKTIIFKLKSKYYYITNKYRIRIPNSVNAAYSFDKKNGRKLWTEEINQIIIRGEYQCRIPITLLKIDLLSVDKTAYDF